MTDDNYPQLAQVTQAFLKLELNSASALCFHSPLSRKPLLRASVGAHNTCKHSKDVAREVEILSSSGGNVNLINKIYQYNAKLLITKKILFFSTYKKQEKNPPAIIKIDNWMGIFCN